MNFEVGKSYRRDRVQDILGVPVERRDGVWNTGYTEFDGEFYIFCTVGAPARTGHDYNNRWVGEELAWEAKAGTHLGQSRMKRIASGQAMIHVFWHTESANPACTRLWVISAPPRPNAERLSPVHFSGGRSTLRNSTQKDRSLGR